MSGRPGESIEITKVDKRREHYTVEGVNRRTGERTSVEIPAPTVEERSRKDADRMMRRVLDGTMQQEREARR